MASCTYFSTLFTVVILGCLLLGNGVTSDDKGNIDSNVNRISKGQHEMNVTESFMENNSAKNCSVYNNCEDCAKSNCTWTLCAQSDYECSDQPEEMCPEVDCTNVTTTSMSPNETTTTPIPTTTDTEPPATNTTTSTTTTTTTSTSTTSTTSTTTPSNTTTISTSTTSVPAPTTPPTTAAPHTRHFDAGSFVGGIILTLTLAAVSFAAWKFYRRRSLATSYTNF